MPKLHINDLDTKASKDAFASITNCAFRENASDSSSNWPLYYNQSYGNVLLFDSEGNSCIIAIRWSNTYNSYVPFIDQIVNLHGTIAVSDNPNHKYMNVTVKPWSGMYSILLQGN